jgi:hypothetical protein
MAKKFTVSIEQSYSTDYRVDFDIEVNEDLSEEELWNLIEEKIADLNIARFVDSEYVKASLQESLKDIGNIIDAEEPYNSDLDPTNEPTVIEIEETE